MRIWKYKLHADFRNQCLDVPPTAIPRHLQIQGGMVSLWLQVDTETAHRQQVKVTCVATGEDIPDGYSYLGTVIYPNKEVYHYFWDR